MPPGSSRFIIHAPTPIAAIRTSTTTRMMQPSHQKRARKPLVGGPSDPPGALVESWPAVAGEPAAGYSPPAAAAGEPWPYGEGWP